MDTHNEIFHSFLFPDLALKKTLELNVAELWAELDSDLNIEYRVLVYFCLLPHVSSLSFATLFFIIFRVKDSEIDLHTKVWAVGATALLFTRSTELAASLLQHCLHWEVEGYLYT